MSKFSGSSNREHYQPRASQHYQVNLDKSQSADILSVCFDTSHCTDHNTCRLLCHSLTFAELLSLPCFSLFFSSLTGIVQTELF